jgi:hypothetical protein
VCIPLLIDCGGNVGGGGGGDGGGGRRRAVTQVILDEGLKTPMRIM